MGRNPYKPGLLENLGFSLRFPGERNPTTLTVPYGFKEATDKFLTHIYAATGHRVSRNDFYLKAIKHYCEFLTGLKNKRAMREAIQGNNPDEGCQVPTEAEKLEISAEFHSEQGDSEDSEEEKGPEDDSPGPIEGQ